MTGAYRSLLPLPLARGLGRRVVRHRPHRHIVVVNAGLLGQVLVVLLDIVMLDVRPVLIVPLGGLLVPAHPLLVILVFVGLEVGPVPRRLLGNLLLLVRPLRAVRSRQLVIVVPRLAVVRIGLDGLGLALALALALVRLLLEGGLLLLGLDLALCLDDRREQLPTVEEARTNVASASLRLTCKAFKVLARGLGGRESALTSKTIIVLTARASSADLGRNEVKT